MHRILPDLFSLARSQHAIGRRPRRLGLSTAELLVVIAIAAVLMAIVFTAWGKVRELLKSWS
jgi:Tfp pilus assembly protein FimT